MSKFSQLLENAFNSNKLKRVRLKVDPAFCERGEISKFQGYEGYILAERDGEYKIYFESLNGEIAIIPQDMLDMNSSLTKLERLKLNTIKYFKNTLKIDCSNVIYQLVLNSPNIETFESFILNNGFSEKDLLNIYRSDYNEDL
jgi:hypothetical protein